MSRWSPNKTRGWPKQVRRSFGIGGLEPASAAPGAIAGVAAVTFTNTGTLVGSGALVGIAGITFANQGAITGAAPISGLAALDFTNSATLVGSGALAGTAVQVFTNMGTLLGTGNLVGTAPLIFVNQGDLTAIADGAISGTITIAFANSALIQGEGTLLGEAILTFVNSGTLSGQPIFPFIKSMGFYGVSYRRKNQELIVEIDEKADRVELRRYLEERIADPQEELMAGPQPVLLEQEVEVGLSKKDLSTIISAILASEL